MEDNRTINQTLTRVWANVTGWAYFRRAAALCKGYSQITTGRGTIGPAPGDTAVRQEDDNAARPQRAEASSGRDRQRGTHRADRDRGSPGHDVEATGEARKRIGRGEGTSGQHNARTSVGDRAGCCQREVGVKSVEQRGSFEPISGFDAAKAIQLCAFFLICAGGRLDKLKLIKLVYLSEREYLRRYQLPMLWDEFYSLQHGPVCSATLNCIDKVCLTSLSDAFFVTHGRRDVHLVRGVSVADFDCMNNADIDVAGSVWSEHKAKTASQIRAYTHTYCPEYTEVDRGRIRISYADMLEAVGVANVAMISEEIEAYRNALAKYD